MNLKNLCLIVYTDASLANVTESSGIRVKTQGGVVIFLCERPKFACCIKIGKKFNRGQYKIEKTRACLIYFSSKRIRRVCPSTLTAETVMLASAVDRAISLKLIFQKVLGCDVPLHFLTDCASLVEHLAAYVGKLTSKRLQIDLEILRESLDTNLVDTIGHCPSELNYGDELTKVLKESAIEKAMSSNVLDLPYHEGQN